jgi:Zn-dependent protease with chaperone function
MAFDSSLRLPRERTLFKLGVAFSALAWVALVVSIVGLVYGAFIGLFVLAARALFLAHVRGNGVRVSERQLPEVHASVKAAAERLGLDRAPEVYVVQGGGALNAFATKLFSRRFVILLSDLVEQCQDRRQLSFVVGHEVGHLAAGHLRWSTFLLPFHLVPWLGAAYSRACEYTADRCGLAVAGDLEQAARALVVLAAGGRVASRADLGAFTVQLRETGGFWMAALELTATHPYLCKRVAALEQLSRPHVTAAVPRHPLAWLLSPVVGGLAGGPGAAPIFAVAMVGVLAAIAIPNFIRYQERARHPAGQAAAGEASPERSAAGLTAEERASLDWVRQVRLQIAQREREKAASAPQERPASP